MASDSKMDTLIRFNQGGRIKCKLNDCEPQLKVTVTLQPSYVIYFSYVIYYI